MQLEVKIKDKKIFVQCEISISEEAFSFALSDSFEVRDFRNNRVRVCPAAANQCEMQFRPAMRKYSFLNLQSGTLSFEYEGALDGSYLFMQEEIYHFSLYNGWYPIGFEVAEQYDVIVRCDDAYELINGQYSSDTKCWYYSTKNQSLVDCNIMLVNKAKSFCFKSEYVYLYYFEQEYETYMQQFFDKYLSIYGYYLQLYGRNKLGFTSVVFLPEKYQLGAYKRDGLIVFSEIAVDIEKSMHTLAHEMAHSYAVGADTSSWEDWLNETHAEWSALLYEKAHNPVYFESLIQAKKEEYMGNYVLNPLGNLRPDDVHETGTLIYYDIYLKYGEDSIKALITTFDQIDKKDTETFLNALKKDHPVLADEIKLKLN